MKKTEEQELYYKIKQTSLELIEEKLINIYEIKDKIMSLASKLENESEMKAINNIESRKKGNEETSSDLNDSDYSYNEEESDEVPEILFNFENQARGYFNLKTFAMQNQITCKNMKEMSLSYTSEPNSRIKQKEKDNQKTCSERKSFKFEIENEKYSKEQKLILYANGRTLF